MLVKRHRHSDELYYVIEQPDGTLAHLPAWMTRCEAAELPDHSPPRLALAALHDLRRLLDQILSSSASQSLRGGDHAQGSTAATGSVCQPGGGAGRSLDRRSSKGDDPAAGADAGVGSVAVSGRIGDGDGSGG